MIGLWILAAALSAAAALLVLARAARASREDARAGPQAASPEARVYRRQLAEIDELAARGLLAEPELAAAKAEAGRRLLGAAEVAPPARPGGRRVVLAAALLAPLLATGLYVATGSPGLPDQPFGERLRAWRAMGRADPSQLTEAQAAAILTAAAKERPDDPTPLLLLAELQARAGQQARVMSSLREAVRRQPARADLWIVLGQTETMAADGKVTPAARSAFLRARALDPSAPEPAYFLARARIAEGDAAAGLAAWRKLLAGLPAQAPQRATLAREIAEVERTGRLPEAQRANAGPARSDAEQRAFIQAMVDRLAARLSSAPDDPAGWARLIRSYGVLGQEDRRRAAVDEARRRYAGRPQTLRAILAGDEAAAAKSAG
jgi:cytochrome c-type biogenesis protein CcmH